MIKTRTITKLFLPFALCFFLTSFAQLQVELHARDSQGYELQQAQVGKPFVLEVVVEGATSHSIEPRIEGVENFSVQRTGYRMSSIGGRKRSLKISYAAQIDTVGSHSIGPAVVQDGTEAAQSNVLILKVDKHEITDSDQMAQREQKKMFVTMSAHNENVVVGQKIEGEIIFFFCTPVSQLLGIKQAPVDGFAIDENSLQQGVQEIDGVQYNYASYKWSLYAKQQGELLIPSCFVDVAVEPEDDFFPHFASFFRAQPQRMRIHSNALTINIASLPPYSEPVDAVGSFRNFTANINQAAAREGDAIVVTLAIEGDADLENLHLELQDVPHVFKSYSSKKKVEQTQDGVGKRLCEHIIQGMEAGEWEIPEQTFTFYDIYSASYKTLKTSALMVRVLPQKTAKTFVPPSVDDASLSTSIDTDTTVGETQLKLNLYGNWKAIPERKMPWWLFMLLVFAPVGIWLSEYLRKFFRRYVLWKEPQTKWRSAFTVAHKKLKIAKKKKDFPALYRLFIELFAIRCSVKEAAVSEQMTKQVLQTGGLSEEKLKEWDRFFADVSAFVFYTVEGADTETELFERADKWITILEEII